MKKSAFISDVIFYGLLIATFTLCLFRFLRIRLFFCLLLGGLCGILASCASAAFLMHKRKNVLLKRSEEGQKQRLLAHLCLLSDEQKTKFLLSALNKNTQNPFTQTGKLRLSNADSFYFLRLHFSPVNADEVASAARWKTDKEKVLVCDTVEENAFLLGEQLGLRFFKGEEIYQAVKSANAFPEQFLPNERILEKSKRRARRYFAKRNAKGFFTGGLLLLLSSLFTPFPYYYLVFGGVLFAIALIVRIFGYR